MKGITFIPCRLCGCRTPVDRADHRPIGLTRHWEGCLLLGKSGKAWLLSGVVGTPGRASQ